MRELDEAVEAVRKRTKLVPEVALILGSGLGAFADELEERIAIPYAEIPGMPVSKVVGHAGKLVLGTAEGVACVAMQGRVHLYEGHPTSSVVFGARLCAKLGAKVAVVTNAAGGANPAFRPGDLMLIEDHLNLTGANALVGPNDDTLGPRFPDMTDAYDPKLRAAALEGATETGTQLVRGVYAGLLGPSYETPAEVRMVGRLGGDAVGMSTVLETVALRHMGVRVLGISCITNQAAGLSPTPLHHGEVEEIAKASRSRFVGVLRAFLRRVKKVSS